MPQTVFIDAPHRCNLLIEAVSLRIQPTVFIDDPTFFSNAANYFYQRAASMLAAI